MSRNWVMGSFLAPPGTSDPGNRPFRAYFSQVGVISEGASTSALSYPVQVNNSGICEIWSRIRNVSCEFAITVVGEGFTITNTMSGTLTGLASEESSRLRCLGAGTPSWSGVLEGETTTTPDDEEADPVTIPASSSAALNISTPMSAFGTPVDPYYYRPASGLWIPSFEFSCGGAIGPASAHNSLDFGPPGPGFHNEQTGGGLYRGTAFDCTHIVQDDYTITSFSVTITPILWLAWAGDIDTDPIYDTATGTKLKDNKTVIR